MEMPGWRSGALIIAVAVFRRCTALKGRVFRISPQFN
jgi:hypothetical protein